MAGVDLELFGADTDQIIHIYGLLFGKLRNFRDFTWRMDFVEVRVNDILESFWDC